MLPEEFSTTVAPGLRRPSRSAFSIMYFAVLSLTLPLGFSSSSLAKMSEGSPRAILFSLSKGVLPVPSMIEFKLIKANDVSLFSRL